VTDDPIRNLLAGIDISSLVRTRPGCVAILRSRVEAAGGNHDAVLAWVEDHGGYLDRTKPITRKSLGPRYGEQIPGEDFYAVPREAIGK
jgi:hypothetical protein